MPLSLKDYEWDDREIRGWLALEKEVLTRKKISRMIEKARKVAVSLKQKHGAEVYLFGSLVRGRVHGRSDIDLLVCGNFSETEKKKIVLEVEGAVAPYPVDVVFADEVGERFKRMAIERGIKLTC